MKLREYIINLVAATREPAALGLDMARYIDYGASPGPAGAFVGRNV